jgi:hypothetical protein
MLLCSGYEFMKLADVCILSNIVDKKITNNIKHIVYINKLTNYDINIIINSNIIFFPTNNIDLVFTKFYSIFKNNITIITHNSDHHICNKNDANNLYIECEKYLELSKIKLWFAQNTLIKHNKLITIPIGIANPQYEHGNIDKLLAIKNFNNLKINLLFINFDIGKGNKFTHRKYVLDILKKNNFDINFVKEKQDNYWNKLSQSKFCISPPGGGVDCHRIWEALFLDTIPIVLNNIAFDNFKDLPILFIENWDVINEGFLIKKYNEFSSKKFNLQKIYINYYNNLIKNKI